MTEPTNASAPPAGESAPPPADDPPTDLMDLPRNPDLTSVEYKDADWTGMVTRVVHHGQVRRG